MNYTASEKVVLPITLLIIIVISIAVYFLLKNKNNKIKNIPLATIAITMLLLEIIKQALEFKDGVYSYWTIPLHFCSLFLFFYPLATLIPNKKIKSFGSTMSFACSLWMTILFYIGPNTIIGNACDNIVESFWTFHTFTYHHLVILYLLIGLLLNQFKIPKNFYLHVFVGMTSYLIIAVPAAHLLNVNFCNILTSNIPLMENIRLAYGQVIYTFVLYLVGLIGSLLACFIYKLLTLKKGGENNE